jgi:hypothetical protein
MMFTSSFTEPEIANYVALTASFIKEQRETYTKLATPLSPAEQETFKPFFSESILKTTRFFHKTDGPLVSPDFFRELNEKGVPFSVDRLKAITFIDTVVTLEELNPRIQFHELVHAVQYQKLGYKQFANKYLRGLLARGSYEKIPLEANARLLDEAFAQDPAQAFSVEADIQKWINENRF